MLKTKLMVFGKGLKNLTDSEKYSPPPPPPPLLAKRFLRCIILDRREIEVVDRFYHLGYITLPGGGCKAATIARCNFLPLLSSKGYTLPRSGKLFALYV